jgi:hypothetical protein
MRRLSGYWCISVLVLGLVLGAVGCPPGKDRNPSLTPTGIETHCGAEGANCCSPLNPIGRCDEGLSCKAGKCSP